jgi:protein-S-isoprenylcysteine O-methyltransferase Ste14
MRQRAFVANNLAMKRYLTVGYGGASYGAFLVAFLYAIGFVGNIREIGVPRSVDHGVAAPTGAALVVNVVLLGLFAVQHSVMARPGFKRWWTRFVPRSIERSTYVLLASAVLLLLYWQWRTMPAVIWDVRPTAGRLALWALFWLGWATVLASTFMISHFDLFGVRQVYLAWRGKPYTDMAFRTRMLYRLVRHPLMLGFLVAFWAAPTMTAGHLLFAIGTTGYILVAIQLEERDLIAELGDKYRDYRRDVPMLLPRVVRPKCLASTNSQAEWRSAPAWRACRPQSVGESNRW